MGKTKRMMMMVAILFTFATVVKGNYYIAENTETEGGDATTVNEEESIVPPTTKADETTKKAFKPPKEEAVKPKERDTGTMPATQTEDIQKQSIIHIQIMKMRHLLKKVHRLHLEWLSCILGMGFMKRL